MWRDSIQNRANAGEIVRKNNKTRMNDAGFINIACDCLII